MLSKKASSGFLLIAFVWFRTDSETSRSLDADYKFEISIQDNWLKLWHGKTITYIICVYSRIIREILDNFCTILFNSTYTRVKTAILAYTGVSVSAQGSKCGSKLKKVLKVWTCRIQKPIQCRTSLASLEAEKKSFYCFYQYFVRIKSVR